MDVNELSLSLQKFGLLDKIVFAAMLCSCSLVGLYFGIKDFRKKKSIKTDHDTLNFLMGGRKMKVFPVAMSLIASLVSGVLLLGASTEIYLYGTQYIYILIAIVISSAALHFVMIPMFHKLQIISVYEYLQMRFDRKVRLFGSIMYIISTVLWLPIMLYVPALAFNQMTGISIHKITPLVVAICIFYTCLGGLKAVVWTDVVQITIMYGTLLLIAIKGTMNVGGISEVFEKNIESGRFEAPDMRLDPTIRHTFLTLVIGGSILYTAHNALNQNMIQRYLSLKSVKAARTSNMIYVIGMIIIIILCCYNGLLLYATYSECDPLQTKLAKAKDQMLPLLVMQTFKDIPGLSGVFIAGIFSAALSSISTGLNSSACVVLEDFFKPFRKEKMSERMCTVVTRGTVIILGSIAIALVYIVQHMGTILQLTLSVPTACFGPLFGVYIIGFFLPWINKRATLIGSIVGFITMMFFVLKVQAEMALGYLKFTTKPMSVEHCEYNFTAPSLTISSLVEEKQVTVPSIYQISYLYYTLIGTVLVILVAFLLSFPLGFEDVNKIDQRLLAPFVRRKIQKSNPNPDIFMTSK
ncbi:unnamed protein product [Chironomus riparius]|uniref:Sodium-coupled monocarboxylate transporter 1 n=1 Tax=Chironomus riparius TaxID=315576 RepID=A0A9N9WWJ2_9DIPT|nr:unnamed protein product [Chironomus riparius]